MAVYYTDGSAIEGQSRGGIGMTTLVGGEYFDWSEVGAPPITNNRMEMMAILRAIQHAKSIGRDEITVYSDSQYVVRTLTPKNSNVAGPIGEYRRKKNKDLWKYLEQELDDTIIVHIEWVKAHNGDPGNERADELAAHAASY